MRSMVSFRTFCSNERVTVSNADGHESASGPKASSTETVETTETAGNGGTSTDSGSEVEKMAQMIREREEALKESRDRTLRLLAEMENVRAIARRDVEGARKYGISTFARELLDVADNLTRALESVPREALNKTEGTTGEQARDSQSLLRALCEGVGATEIEMQRVFRKFGIERYGALGDRFDPEMHQAMFEASEPGTDTTTEPAPKDKPVMEDGSVMHILKMGYKIHDRVLRPAEVGVLRKK